MIASSRSYAIGMAHFQMAGGWKMLALVCGLYVVFFLSGLGLYYYMDVTGGGTGKISPVVVGLLFGIESTVLLLLGSSRVSAVIRRDLSSGMIESHRLMPIPSWRAVAGYLIGGTMGAMSFGLINVLLALVMGGVAGASLGQIVLAQAVLFTFAFLTWSFSAVTTFQFRYLYFIVGGLLVLGMCSGMLFRAYTVVPGVSLLLSPLFGETIFSYSTSSTVKFQWIYPAAFFCQGAFFALFFAGSCRRYRGVAPTTFSVFQALMLLGVWCAACGLGLALHEELSTRRSFFDPDDGFRRVQVVASLITLMVLAAVPLATIAVERGRGMLPRAVVPLLLVACTVGIAAVMFGALEVAPGMEAYWATPLVAAAHVVTVYAGFRLVRRLPALAGWAIVGAGVGALWLGPLILELMFLLLTQPTSRADGLGMLGTMSPLGLLVTVWTSEEHVTPIAGLAVQAVLAGVLAMVLMMPGRRRAAGSALVPTVAAHGSGQDPAALDHRQDADATSTGVPPEARSS